MSSASLLPVDHNLPATFKPHKNDDEPTKLAKLLANTIARKVEKKTGGMGPYAWCGVYLTQLAIVQTKAKLSGKSARVSLSWLNKHWRYWPAIKAAVKIQTEADAAFVVSRQLKKIRAKTTDTNE